MSRRFLENEFGYSLVEVVVSILILSIAIIPMVSMFDIGLKAATKGGNYDKARAFANAQLEQTKNLSYKTVKDDFPVAGSTPSTGTGNYSSGNLDVPTNVGLPSGSKYKIEKQYVYVPDGPGASFINSAADTGSMRVTVTVDWSGTPFTVSGVVAGGLL